MKTITKNGYEITVVDRREDYEDRWAEQAGWVGWESCSLLKRQLEGAKLQHSLKKQKAPRLSRAFIYLVGVI